MIVEEDRVRLVRQRHFSPEITDFLDNITLGTTETLYQHKGVRERCLVLSDPDVYLLYIDGDLAATVVADGRETVSGELRFPSKYFRYFASKVTFRNRRLVGVYGRVTMQRVLESAELPSVFYMAVERKNYKSFNFTKRLGYREITHARTIGFSRFWPKVDRRFRALKRPEEGKMMKLLRDFYRNHTLRHFNYVGEGDYFVLEEKGEIVAGLQVHATSWIVKSLPSALGGMFVRYGHHIPVLKKLISRGKFDFLALEGLYWQTGRERDVLVLMESVLAHFQCHAALTWVDYRDPNYQKLTSAGRLGALHRFVRDTETIIALTTRHLTAEEEQHITQGPVYISSFDFI